MIKRKQTSKKKSTALSWTLFIGTVEIVLVSLISVVFPALLIRSVSLKAEATVSEWETGPLAIPLIVINLILLGIGIAYYKNLLPSQIKNPIKFIFNFDVSKKVAFIVLAVFLGIYIGFSYQELAEEERHGDYPSVVRLTENWSLEKMLNSTSYAPHFRWFYLQSSLTLFDNIRVIPFIISISLVITTYFITVQLSQKRFAGLVAAAILLQSAVFLKYDTEATYENGWTLLFILSLFALYKAWPLSPVAYVLSILSKQLTIAFLPMIFFFIYRAKIPRKRKIYVTIPYLVLGIIGLAAIFLTETNLMGESVPYSDFDFWVGFTSFAYQLRIDYVVVIFLLPLVVGLSITARKGFSQADPVLFLIIWMLFLSPILTGFTELTNQPYRYIPLVVFFAMGVGVILSKKEVKFISQV